jgi:hypothetical protein
MGRITPWLRGALVIVGLGLIAPVHAADSQQELKQLDTLEGYKQLPDEKSVGKDLTNVPNQPIETLIVWSEATPTHGTAPLTVQFAADPPPGVSDAVYTWQFGDGGATATEQSVSHRFEKPGICLGIACLSIPTPASLASNPPVA